MVKHTGVAQVWKSAVSDTVATRRRSEVRILPPVRLNVRWAEELGRPDCPYMKRWVLDLGWLSIRLHHWMGSDDPRFFHDHPWPFITVVLKGAYTDSSEQGLDVLRTGAVRKRPALWRHTVLVPSEGCWTLLLTGPVMRKWGFWVKGKFKKANKYFLTHGHHPCN